MNKTITHLNTRDELARIDFNDVMAIIADGNYVTLTMRSGRSVTLLSGLHDMELVARRTCNSFLKVGRSHIVNLRYVVMVNVAKQTITIADDSIRTSMDLHISKDGAIALKHYLETLNGEPISEFIPANGHMSATVMDNS